MVSSKSINFITFVITFIIEISNANYCLEEITKRNVININYNGAEAFQHVYLHLNFSKVEQGNKDILRQYILYLFDAAILGYNFDQLQNPLDWCKANVDGIVLGSVVYFARHLCHAHLFPSGYDIDKNAITALQHSYFNLIYKKMNNCGKKYEVGILYYDYLLREFLPHVYNSPALGPRDYCNPNNRLYVPIENTSIENQLNPVTATAHDSIERYETAEYSGAQIQDQNPYADSNLLPECTSAACEIITASKAPITFDLNQPVYFYNQEENRYTNQDYNLQSESTSYAIENNTAINNPVNIDGNQFSAVSQEQYPKNYNNVPFQPYTFTPYQGHVFDLNSVPEDFDYSTNK